jgi:transposase InsO family protein
VELRLSVELLETKIELFESGRSPGPADAVAWGSAFSVRWRRRFHLARVCRVWRISRATLYRHRKGTRQKPSRSLWTDEELVRRLQPGIARGLRIRCENLPLFRERQFCRHLAELGIRASYIAPLGPRGNGLAERFVRTLRENRLAIWYFASIEHLDREMAAFREVYNNEYILQRWKYRTPNPSPPASPRPLPHTAPNQNSCHLGNISRILFDYSWLWGIFLMLAA